MCWCRATHGNPDDPTLVLISVHQMEVQRRLTCLPEPTELSAGLSTLSAHFLLLCVAGGLLRDLLHARLFRSLDSHDLSSNYDLFSSYT